ncbi:unnamed protein product [Phytomonas sp. EM1]|nr:unnamed protein product [Phytomonas sp. EM1]|eukprot:CCW61922.1 unnamed protein product [Phytomonas sp. isolate EM1]
MLGVSRPSLKATILLSSGISSKIRKHVAREVAKLPRPPYLMVLHIGSRPDSLSYIRLKKKAAEECGINYGLKNLPETISQTALHRELTELSNNPAVDGILLQLPLPGHLRVISSLLHIHPNKDVDGLNILNSGNLFLRDQVSLTEFLALKFSEKTRCNHMFEDAIIMSTGESCFSELTRESHEANYFIPCTALSVRCILLCYLFEAKKLPPYVPESEVRNLHVVIVNRSMVVGIPTAALLQKEGFIVTICGRNNSLESLKKIMKTADIVITAYGQAEIFNAEFFKEGAVIIDVGINELPVEKCGNGNSSSAKHKICGDVNLASVLEVASAISPTPGGVGPLTVAYLMQNILKASRLRCGDRTFMDSIYSSSLKAHEADDIPDQKSTLPPQYQSLLGFGERGENVDDNNFGV